MPGEEESWEDDVDQRIMSNDHDENDQVTDGGGHLETDRQLTGDMKPGAGNEPMVSKGKGRGRGKRVPQQIDEVGIISLHDRTIVMEHNLLTHGSKSLHAAKF